MWRTGLAARAVSRANPEWRHEFEETLPDLREEETIVGINGSMVNGTPLIRPSRGEAPASRNGSIEGVLPLVLFRSALFGRFAVSLPFVNYGGVLAADEQVSRALLERAATLAAERGLAHVELRHQDARFPDLPSKRHKVAMKLALEADAARAWDALDRKVRNQVRKAEKSDMTVEIGGLERLDDFY